MLKFALFIAVVAGALPAAATCKWTAERTEDFFAQKLQYIQKPKIEKATCRTGLPPVCSGYVTCPGLGFDDKGMPKASAVACKSVPVPGTNKWRCPTAQICYDDEDIQMSPTKLIPAETGAAPAAAPAAPAATTN